MISISVSLQLSLRDLTTLFMELFSNNEQQLEIILLLIIVVKCHINLFSIVNYRSKIKSKINQKLFLLDSIIEVFGIRPRFNKKYSCDF